MGPPLTGVTDAEGHCANQQTLLRTCHSVLLGTLAPMPASPLADQMQHGTHTMRGSRTMESLAPLHQRTSPRQSPARLSLCAAVGAASVAMSMVSGCTSRHDRPGGHADVTFRVSPQGNVLVFNAVGRGGRDLYLLDLTRLTVSPIAKTPEYEVAAGFSPDGRSVVYAAGKPADRADHLFVRRLDGGDPKQITAEDANDYSPQFSPDGSLIVFARDKTYNWGGLAPNWDGGGVVCVVSADGSGLRQITNDDVTAMDPRFSPDGRSILYWGVGGLYKVRADGAESPARLISGAGREATYSPDGQFIAFSMGHFAPDHEIFVCRADGSQRVQVTHLGKATVSRVGAGCFMPNFTADSQRIIFLVESWPDGAFGHPKRSLWEIPVEGGTARKLAGYRLFDSPLDWSEQRERP